MKKMNDYLIRGLLKDCRARFMAVTTAEIVEKAIEHRDASPLAITALGRLISMGAMMGLMNKEEIAKMSLRIQGDGPLGLLIVDANAKGEIRGYIQNPNVYLPISVSQAIGKGRLTVVIDLGVGYPFNSEVPIQSGEIGEDFAYYFTMSEQTPTLVALGTQVNENRKILSSGGLIIQMLPDAQEEDYLYVEKLGKELNDISEKIKNNIDLETMLTSIGINVEFIEAFPLKYKCGCNKRKYLSSLATLDKEELFKMINEDHGAEIICNFCGKKHYLDEIELKKVININKK